MSGEEELAGDIQQPVYIQPPKLVPIWDDEYKPDKVVFEKTPLPEIVGKKGNSTCKDYSKKKNDRHGNPNFCSGGFKRVDDEEGTPYCPANSPRIGNYKLQVVMDGTEDVMEVMTFCEGCLCKNEKQMPPGCIPANIDLPSEDDYVFRTDDDDLEDLEITSNTGILNMFPGFMGSKSFASLHVNAADGGLISQSSGDHLFSDIGEVQEDMLQATEDHKIFTTVLVRNVILSPKGSWWNLTVIALLHVVSFSNYYFGFLSDAIDLVDGWASFYLGINTSGTTTGLFDWHRDAGILYGAKRRRVLTLLHHSEGYKKRMYFVDRITGAWFSFIVPHGWVVDMGHVTSGFNDGRYQHKVEDAEGTYAIVLQVSQ